MLELHSPAKVNLFLKILGKRPDGYHEFASLLQAISLCDTISFEKTANEKLTCSEPRLPLNGSNLILKATQLFRAKTGIRQHFRVHLNKHIPIEAGLGGGSSNAATTLWAINQLCDMPATLDQLIEWGGTLGSDVPFFLSRGTAYCTGRGEKVRPLPPLSEQTLWIVKPPQGLSTPQVYRALDLTQLCLDNPHQALESFISGRGTFFNDLEPPALKLDPSLRKLRQSLLDSGFNTVLLS